MSIKLDVAPRRACVEISIDTRVRLIAQPNLTGRIHLIDWSLHRASVLWDNGLLSGVALADLTPVVEVPAASRLQARAVADELRAAA